MRRFSRFFYSPCLPLGESGKRVTGSPEHIAFSLKAACEGMVLLKNDNGILPLAKGTKVAVFGTAQFDYVRGGGGSGDVTTEYTRNIYEGLKLKEGQGLLEVYEPVSLLYKASVDLQKEQNGPTYRCEQPDLPISILEDARKFTDTAIMTICRYSWEGGDRKGGQDDGDYYLSEKERDLRDTLVTSFDNVIVVLDIGGVMDATWIKNDKQIDAALLAWQAGIEGGTAIADTLCGLSNPSGRLVDTFADSFMAYPSSEHFSDSLEYVDCTEDVYVGYRWFSTFDPEGEHVVYPFGYGLSYTSFTVTAENLAIPEDENGSITVDARITNTGSFAGRNAVGLYYSAPQGVLGKPARELGAFAKSGLLQPGESEIVSLSFPVRDMASYDDTGKVADASYVLEAGVYRLFLGANVMEAEELGDAFELDSTVVVETLAHRCVPHALGERLLADGSYEKLATDDSEGDGRTTCYNGWTVPTGRTIMGRVPDGTPDFEEVISGRMSVTDYVKALPTEMLAEMLGGQPNTGVANTFGMGNFPEVGIPNVMTADGPAGLRIEHGVGVNTTAWPIATMIACTWDPAIAEEIGRMGGLEVRENNIGLWLTPAMNIHRTPLCGRNFEYYSEDPLISGKMGAAMIRGIQSSRVGATMKHFACNGKEEDRFVCDTRVSERALREIYLRGFEIAVKEGQPWAVMSSYNRLNGSYTSRCKDLLTGILREEWGYDGMVTTDWMNRSDHASEVLAGNDLKMPIGEPKVLAAAVESGKLEKSDLERSAARILRTILRFD